MVLTSIDRTQRRAARAVGFTYLLTNALAYFAEFHVRARLIDYESTARTAKNILASEHLFRMSLAADLLTFAGDVVIIVGSYLILSSVNRSLAIFGFRSLKEHLAYITRNGKLDGERESGELIRGAAGVQSLAAEWWGDCGIDRPTRARDTINLILSMPPGTDPQAVAEAARAFAHETFGNNYDYLLAHHNHDSDPKRPENPHAHACETGDFRHGYAALRGIVVTRF
jgi:Domain of unknown function (DUF4386)/MobA/VirD2-like, nuclease domain